MKKKQCIMMKRKFPTVILCDEYWINILKINCCNRHLLVVSKISTYISYAKCNAWRRRLKMADDEEGVLINKLYAVLKHVKPSWK